MDKKILTQEYLHTLFEYKDGILYWKKAKEKVTVGNNAGCISNTGYLCVGIDRTPFLNHRVIFMMHKGYMPIMIDHIDGNKLNNKIENLRETTRGQNRMNSKLQSNNISGAKNVNWNKKHKKWYVQLSAEGKKLYFGSYFDLNVARFVAETMRHKYHKQFSRSI